MNGKYLVFGIVASAIIMGGAFFFVLKHSADTRHIVAEQIQQEFLSYATEVKQTQKLQVAQLNQVEVFQRTSSLSLFWNQVKMPEVVVSITTPVQFIYTVDMTGPWEFIINGQTLIVNTPALEFNQPSPNISATKFEVKKGSMFRDEQQILRALQNQITPALNERAKQNTALVLETARKSIKDFVVTWMNQKFQQDQQKLVVEVRFPGELESPIAPAK